MKILRNIFIGLFIVIVLAIIGGVIFLKTFDINRYREQITTKASEAIGRKVEIGHLALAMSLKTGIVLRLENVSLADDASFGTNNLFSAKLVDLKVDLEALISKKEVVVLSVSVDNPQIYVIKNPAGELNVQAFASSVEQAKTAEATADSSVTSSPSSEESEEPLSISVQHVLINNATVVVEDQQSNPKRVITVDQIVINVDNFSFNQFFPLDVTARLLSQESNLQLSAQAKVDPKGSVELKDLAFNTDLKKLSYEALVELAPELKGAGISPNWEGEVAVNVPTLSAGAQGVTDISGNMKLTNAAMQIASVPYPLTNINAAIDFTAQKAVIKQAELSLASGIVSLEGEMLDPLNTRTFDVTVNAKDLSVPELAAPYKLPINIQGTLVAKANLKGQAIDEQTARQSLSGEAELTMAEGKLIDLNVLKLILNQLSLIPGLMEKLNENLSETNKARLEEKDTEFKEVIFKGNIVNQAFNITQGMIDAEDFIFTVGGSVGFDQNAFIQSALMVSAPFSADMAKSAEELAAFLNEKGQIQILLKDYSGPIAGFKPFPNVEDIAKKVIKQKAGEELGNVLRKAMGIEEEEPSGQDEGGQTTPNNQSETPSQEQKPEDVLINGILNQIFK